MKKSGENRSVIAKRSALCEVLMSVAFAGVLLAGSWAQAHSPEVPAPVAGGVVTRVLLPAEKARVLETELAKEVAKRVKLEEENARRISENSELVANLKIAQKERAALEAKQSEARDREILLQRANDRLREETERVTVSVRYALPIIAGMAIMMLAMLVWLLLFLRQVAARVHDQRTLSEMHELEGRVNHTTNLLNAEVKRTQALRHKLAELGITD